jgi:small conductance mechanosensitive channel
MERTAAQMWADPAWRAVITAEPEVWGIQDVAGDSVLVRVTARTAPLRKADVARELRERLKAAVAGLSPAGAAGVAGTLAELSAGGPALAVSVTAGGGTAGPGAAEPETAEPETAEPETAEPETAEPGPRGGVGA